jgi:hypothetical protein
MTGSATTATYAQPLENGCALSRCQPQAQPAQPRPYRECGEGCAPPALSLRRLGAPTLRARLPSASTSSSRPNRTDEHGTDCITDQLHGRGCSSSFHSTVDIRFISSTPCSDLVSHCDQQSASLLASTAIGIDLTHLFAVYTEPDRDWEWYGKFGHVDRSRKLEMGGIPGVRPDHLSKSRGGGGLSSALGNLDGLIPYTAAPSPLRRFCPALCWLVKPRRADSETLQDWSNRIDHRPSGVLSQNAPAANSESRRGMLS